MLRHEPLQNGNWVHTLNDGYVKVSGMTKTKIAYHDSYGKFKWVRKEVVYPAHITEEVLEKNGFFKGSLPGVDGEPCWTLTETKNMQERRFVRLWWYDGVKNKNTGVWMVDVKGPYTTIHRTVKFVHELQIAMQFGFIDKKIEL